MTPPDSCPGKPFLTFNPERLPLTDTLRCEDSFSPTSGPLFPHISRLQHPFDRMADYQRVPAL